MANVVVVGLGNLGSRHLQGLAGCRIPLRIGLIDPSESSIKVARERWHEAGGGLGPHVLLDSPVSECDIAIVATTADVRRAAIEGLVRNTKVGAWLLEKPISQSTVDSFSIASAVADSSAWVNLPRRLIHWHRVIRSQIRQVPGPLDVLVSGGSWGLACNAIHFVDMVRWWTSAEPTSIDASSLAAEWHPSKRAGYQEVFGTLRIAYSDGSQLTLVSAPEEAAHIIEIQAGTECWTVSERSGLSLRNGAQATEGRMELQSTLTGRVVESILRGADPELPTLEETLQVESLLLDALIQHRAMSGGPNTHLDFT